MGEWEILTWEARAYRIEVDEEQATAKLTEIIRLKNSSIINQSVEYVIVAAESGNDLSSFLTSEYRRNQKILTLVGKAGVLATEMILLGENFFEYSKASSGRMYVSSGKVKKAVSVGDDAAQQFMDTIEKRQKNAR